MYMAGVVGNMGGGLIEAVTLNWIPLFGSHGMTYVYQVLIGLSFTAIYFFVFRFLILKFNIATPGREKDDQQETKLYSKQEYRERKTRMKQLLLLKRQMTPLFCILKRWVEKTTSQK